MLKPEFKLIINENQIKDNTYKLDFGYYNYDKNSIIINLPLHLLYSTDEEKLWKLIGNTISHEYLHYTIWQCRKSYKHKLRYDFFEEKIIAEIMKEKWDEEKYYYLIQDE